MRKNRYDFYVDGTIVAHGSETKPADFVAAYIQGKPETQRIWCSRHGRFRWVRIYEQTRAELDDLDRELKSRLR